MPDPLVHPAAQHHLHWGAEDLWLQLRPLLPDLSIEILARTDSTNTQLLERARHSGADAGPASAAGRRVGDAQPCLLVAEQQTHGRGRQGKAWFASAGASLTFSLSLPLAPADWSGLSLAVGVALADAFDPPQEGKPPHIGLKWPNDLLVLDEHQGLGRKLGGILIETVAVGARRMAIIGIGLNVKPQTMAELPWGYACLQELQPEISAPQALATLALPLLQTILDFERLGFAPLQPRYARRDALLGRNVSTTLADVPEGVADGIDEQGALWLRTASGRQRVSSGEVSIRMASVDAAAPGGSPAPGPESAGC